MINLRTIYVFRENLFSITINFDFIKSYNNDSVLFDAPIQSNEKVRVLISLCIPMCVYKILKKAHMIIDLYPQRLPFMTDIDGIYIFFLFEI